MPRSLRTVVAALALVIAGSVASRLEPELLAQVKKSDAFVKVTAKGGKADSDGKQAVTITIQIEKGWHIYANPVGDDSLKPVQTVVTVTGKEKPQDVKVEYPEGKTVKDPDLKIEYKTYEDKVEIKAQVQRAKGDSGPLEVSVKVQACTDKNCLLPATVKVAVE
jgi:DsbC/DsbD-like thiol-disulfide interchange protein